MTDDEQAAQQAAHSSAMAEAAGQPDSSLIRSLYADMAVMKIRLNQSAELSAKNAEKLNELFGYINRGRGALWVLGILVSVGSAAIWFRHELASRLAEISHWMGGDGKN